MAKKNYDIDDVFGGMQQRRKNAQEETTTVEQPVVNETVAIEEPKVEPVKEEKVVVAKEPEIASKVEDFNKQIKESKENKQIKESKETLQKKNTEKKEDKKAEKEDKKYYYGQKRTFAINDANWEEVMIYIGAVGKTQHEYINELIEADIRKNAKIIEMAKELRRQTKGDKK